MNCDVCWKVMDDSDVVAEFDSDEFVICYECTSDDGEEFTFGKF